MSVRSRHAVAAVMALLLAPAALVAQAVTPPEGGEAEHPRWSADPNTTVRNNFGPMIGPGASMCRGACGGGCHPNNCEELPPRFECVDAARFRIVRSYKCHTHQGCRDHDDCLDECARRYPGTGRLPNEDGIVQHMTGWRPERNFYLSECSSACHAEAALTYGPEVATTWPFGYESRTHPRDGDNVFEYTKPSPDAEEPIYRCPEGTHLVCDDGPPRCEEGEEPDDDEPADGVAGVDILGPLLCNDPAEPVELEVAVTGLPSRRVHWNVTSGPGSIDADGTLSAHGEGTVVVEAVSVDDPLYRDEVSIDFGDCVCAFTARAGGDTNRTHSEGDWAVFSTRGQASIMGAAGASKAAQADYLEDLSRGADMAAALRGMLGGGGGGGEGSGAGDALGEALDRKAAELRREPGGSGSTINISLIEGGPERTPQVGMAGAFKVDLLSEVSIPPGFAGSLPVRSLALHTGEFAAEGGAPTIYLWEPGKPGDVQLQVWEYDGQFMRGTVSGNLVSMGIFVNHSRLAKVRFSADFVAGLYNPLRMEMACTMARIEAARAAEE